MQLNRDDIEIDENDIVVTSGCEAVHPDRRGGQHVARPCTGVRIVHKPTGLVVVSRDERSQLANKKSAMLMLRRQLVEMQPVVFECYGNPASSVASATSYHDKPSMVNFIRLRRYRVTVEMIEEPVEVLRDRLRQLWRESERNTHYWNPMRETAVTLGMDPDELRYEDQGKDHKRGA